MSLTPGEIAGESPAALRAGALSLIETAGQSLAAVGPSLTPALNISVVVAMAGVGCWLSFFLGTLGVIIVAISVGILAVRHPEAGSYFVYIGRTFGPFTGALAGWAMISAYLFTAIATTLSFVIFLGDFVAAFKLTLTPAAQAAAMLLFIGLVASGAYRDIRLSSRIGLLMEIISLSIMIIIMAAIVKVRGSMFDAAQLNVSALKIGGVFSALPFVIFSFVGFESSATLAKESANPKRNIPLSILGCAAFSGVFFTLMAYFMMLASGDDALILAKSTAPFGDVAAKAGLAWASMIVYFAAIVSVYACSLASVNAAARLLFSMGRYRFLHRSMGLVHPRYRTPHRAVILCGALITLVCVSIRPLGYLDAFGLAGTFASFGFVVVYLGVCMVAPLDLKRGNLMRWHHVLIGALGAALMLFVMLGSVYPVPDYPFNVLPYVFFGYMVLGAVWFGALKRSAPQVLAAIQQDMEQ